MKTAFFCLPLLAAILHAQSPDDTATVARMTSDLLPLKLAMPPSEPLKDEVYARAELDSQLREPQRKAIESLQQDLMKVQSKYIPAVDWSSGYAPVMLISFFSRDQGYKLTSVLAGRNLSEENLRPLVEGIVAMAESAVECRNTSSPLQNSATFHSSIEKVGDALQALGVSNADIRAVADSLFRGARAAATPPIRTTYK